MLENSSLYMRKLTYDDFDDLCRILQDPQVMYAYEGAFTKEEVGQWLDNQLRRYEEGLGLYAVILKENNVLIGQCGITKQLWGDRWVLEIGYLFNKDYWHKGYATASAQLWKEYAFTHLDCSEIFSIIRENNLPSIKIALNNGMVKVGNQMKHYKGINMAHEVFSVSK